MNRKITLLIAIPAILILLAGSFLLLEFRLLNSTDRTESSVSSGRSNTVAAPPNLPVYVWVEEKDRLSTRFRDYLLAELNASGRVQATLLPTAKPGPQDYPIVRVWIARPALSWTPVYAQSDLLVRFSFSTFSTDVPQEEQQPIEIKSEAGVYGLIAQGNVTLKDTSFGLVSLPGYWDHLAQQAARPVAAEIVKTIQ